VEPEPKFFDNRKAGKSTPRTSGRLRLARGSDGVDDYKFCSSRAVLWNKANSAISPTSAESKAREASDRTTGKMEPQESGR